MTLWKWGHLVGPEEARPQAPLPQPGEAVQLQVASDGGGMLYSARVHAIGLRRLFLETAEALALPPRAALTLTFVRGDALYRFETRLIGPVRVGGLAVARPRRVVRLQRRQYYRLLLESPTVFRLLMADGRRDGSGPIPARLINLSGGGALLSCTRAVPAGLAVSVRVPAGLTGEALDVEAETLDCRVVSQGAARVYLVRLRFFDPPRLDPDDREAIIAYIFQQQRMMLKGRKLLRA